MKHIARKILLSSLVASTFALSFSQAIAAEEINIYSARKEALIKPLLDKFTEISGVKIQLVTGKDDALLEKLKLEGENTPADLLFTADAGRLHRAKAMGLTQAITSDILNENIPANLRDRDNQWVGLTYRARPIMYAKDRVDPAELSSYEDLADPKWKGKICIRSSSNIYNQSLLASVIEADGAEAAGKWAKALVKNFARPPAGGDTDQIKAAAAGECDIAIANTYYLARLASSKDANDRKVAAKIGVFWPNQGEDARGTHINVSGAALTKAAQNKENAIKLLEFMTNDGAQAWYSEVNGEYPVKAGVEISEILKQWGDFKSDELNLSILGENNAEAVKLMDKAGWK